MKQLKQWLVQITMRSARYADRHHIVWAYDAEHAKALVMKHHRGGDVRRIGVRLILDEATKS